MALEGQEVARSITLGDKATQQTLGGGLLMHILAEGGLGTLLGSDIGNGEEG